MCSSRGGQIFQNKISKKIKFSKLFMSLRRISNGPESPLIEI